MLLDGTEAEMMTFFLNIGSCSSTGSKRTNRQVSDVSELHVELRTVENTSKHGANVVILAKGCTLVHAVMTGCGTSSMSTLVFSCPVDNLL